MASGLSYRIFGACVITLMIAGAGCWMPGPTEVTPLYVATPMLRVEPPEAAGVGDLPVEAITLATLNTLASLEQVYPLDSQDVDELRDLPVSELATAVAADEVLSAVLLTGERRVQLTRFAANGQVRWQGSVPLPEHDVQALIAAVTSRLQDGFRDRPRRRPALAPAAQSDYLAMLRVKQDIEQQRYLSLDPALAALHAIRTRAPVLVEASMIEMLVSSYLHKATGQSRYQARANHVMSTTRVAATGDPRILRAAVDMAFADGDLDAAERAIGELAQRAPLLPRLVRYQARLAMGRGEIGDAIGILERSLQHRLCWPNLRVLADLEMRAGQPERAREHLAMALALTPQHAAVLDKLGELELRSGDPARAREIFLGLIADHQLPKASYLGNLGTADLLLAEYDEALVSYRQAWALGLRSFALRLNLADLDLLQGNPVAAARQYQEIAASLEGKSSCMERAVRAYCNARCGHVDQAWADLTVVMERRPPSPEISFLVALTQRIAGSQELTCKWIDRATELGMSRSWFALPWFAGLQCHQEQGATGERGQAKIGTVQQPPPRPGKVEPAARTAKTNRASDSKTRASEIQASEIQASEIQASEIQASEIQASEIQASEIQASE